MVEKLAEQQRNRKVNGLDVGSDSGSGSERSPPPAIPALAASQPFTVSIPLIRVSCSLLVAQQPAVPFIFAPEAVAFISPPSAARDNLRIEHPGSPPLPTGLTPFTNPESTGPTQLKLDAFISRDLAIKVISLYFEHVSSPGPFSI